MKVLFIVNIDDIGFEEPMGILYLSSACKRAGHETSVVSCYSPTLLETVEKEKPDILAYSVMTANYEVLLKVNRILRRSVLVPSVFGGPHATFYPEILEEESIDYVFRGECEGAFPLFLDLLQKNESIENVPNIGYKRDGKAYHTQLENLVNELDEIALPDRELFSDLEMVYRAEVRSVIASRGCPYKCSYCFNNQYHIMYDKKGKKYRTRSLNNVIEECRELKEKYGAKMIHFFDDIFPPQKQWIREFAERFPKEVGLPFITNTSFNVCTEHYVTNLAKAGCKCLFIGVETGNEKLREEVLFRKMNNDDIVSKAAMIRGNGIRIYTQNLLGLPLGSYKYDVETVMLNARLKADYAGAYLCQPYPKTAIESIAREAGLLKDEMNFSNSFYHSCNLILDDEEKINKLRVLFPILVNFPSLIPHLETIMKMPQAPFVIFGKMLHGYKIKTCILRYDMTPTSFLKHVKLFFKRPINKISSGS